MTTISTELYDALISAKVPEEKARAAATVIIDREEIATKSDLAAIRSDLKDLEIRLIKWGINALITQLVLITGILFSLIKILS